MTNQPSPPPNPGPKKGQRPDLTNPDEQQTLDPSFLLTSGSSSSVGSVPMAEDSDLSFLSPPQSPEEIGRLSNYRVFQILGEGGMGMVLEAEDIKLKRRVAIKVMKPEIARKEQHRARFLREAQAAAAVEHDHIIPIYQIGEENGVPFIAMPFLKGEPLDAHLRNQQMEPAEVMLIGRQAAEGLAAAHAQGLIHRDIKPGNIWLESSTAHNGQIRVKILDFGLARLTSDVGQLTQSGAVLGTPAYMAPEQARGRPVDHRADIFSLGCVMYEMATGQRPFTGPDTMAVLSSLALDEPEAPLELNPELPPILSRLIMMMLQKDPAKRPPNATEVAGVLRKLQPENTVVVIARSTPVPAENPWSNIDASSSTNFVDEPSQVDETLSREVIPPNREARPVSRDAKALRSGASDERDTASGGRSKKGLLIGAALLCTLAIAAIVIFIIRDKDGNKLAEIKVPKGGTVEVKDEPNTPDVRKENEPLVETPSNDFALGFDKKAKATLPVSVDLSTPYTIEAVIDCDDKGGFPILSLNKFNLVGGPSWGFKSIGQKGTFAHSITSKIDAPAKAHVACVFDGTAMRIFVNGKLAGATLVEADPPKKLVTLLELGLSFSGTIDELRVSSVARYDKDFTPPSRHASDSKTLALYHCDDGQGEIVKDSSGNNHHGKITGAKWVKADGTPIGALPPKVKNALGMEFALVPKGKSWLGGGDGKPGEKEVEFKDDFYLGTYEVTQEEWEKVMGANPSNYSRKGISRGAVTEISDDDLKRFPVETVSWDECRAFVAKVNEKAKETGWVYRLPTEAEWEYACRGGPLTDKAESAFSYYFDQPTNTLDEIKVNAKHSRRTMKVGSYPPNRLGLFDMHGNVSEWCEDVVEDDNRVSRGSTSTPYRASPMRTED